MRLRALVVTAVTLALAPVAVPAQGSLLGLLGGSSTDTGAQWNVFGRPCSPIAVPTAGAFAAGTCPGVRPGAVLLMEGGGQCTFNFMFAGGDGRTYMGTAGHCALGDGGLGGGDAGERTWASGTGPVVSDGAGRPVGRFTYAIVQEPKDFALVQLDAGVAASPEMCGFGGPTGIDDDPNVGAMDFFGEGVVVGDLLPARGALGLQSDQDKVYALGVALPGDSGSAVTSVDGRAVGVLVGLSVGVGLPPQSGIVITRLRPQLTRAAQALGTTLTLRTAPRL
jgi:hypothetical protein